MNADRTIQHLRYIPGAVDAHGNDIDAWSAPTDVQVFGWAPHMNAEPGGTQTVEGLDVYAPKELQVDERDRMQVDGLLYDVEGEPADWSKGPFGQDVGQKVINLQRVEGGR